MASLVSVFGEADIMSLALRVFMSVVSTSIRLKSPSVIIPMILLLSSVTAVTPRRLLEISIITSLIDAVAFTAGFSFF